MIISHKHKLIFIAIPKTGTHAIRIALRKHMDENDVEQVKLFTDKKAPYKEIADKPHGHIKAQEILKAVGKEMWDPYFKFACVRNPWDRFISFAFFMHRANEALKSNPLPTLKQIIVNAERNNKILFIPQYEFVTDAAGKLMVDHICRFENLQESYDEVCLKAGLQSEKLSTVNKSEHLPYAEYYDDELREQVARIYKKDIELFQYNF